MSSEQDTNGGTINDAPARFDGDLGDNGSVKHHAEYANVMGLTKEETLQHVIDSFKVLAVDTNNWIANLANCSSLLWYAYRSLGVNVNWVGFYVRDSGKVNPELILGPFQGKVACQTILFGRGVCGTAASTQTTQLVPNVNEYSGHIACDGETNSEIVVPLILKGETIAVLDLDCITLNGFDKQDQKYLESLAIEIVKSCDWNRL